LIGLKLQLAMINFMLETYFFQQPTLGAFPLRQNEGTRYGSVLDVQNSPIAILKLQVNNQ
jgi:hypothetical protein